MFCEVTEAYREQIQKRVVDDNGNRDITKASFLWLVDHSAITAADFDKFLQIKKVRNKYAHELFDVIKMGITESEITLLFDMHSLYRKISLWFFDVIERPTSEVEMPPAADANGIQTVADFMFSIILNVLYNGKSEEYQSIIASIKDGQMHEI